MPEQKTLNRAHKDKQQGKAASTQAGEFVREEMDHIREGKHGARSSKQAIAIGLSKARRAGVDMPPPKKGSAKMKKQAARDTAAGKQRQAVSKKRSEATTRVLKHEGHKAASHEALSKQAHNAAQKRGPADRHKAARKAVETKGKAGLHYAAVKAAHTRAAHASA
jgi:hypothetical protein